MTAFIRRWGRALTSVLQDLQVATGATGWERDVTWVPIRHQLDSVELVVRMDDGEGGSASLAAHGRSKTKRANLWSYQEFFDQTVDSAKGYSLGDAVHHIVLVCQQDRPNTLERLNFALAGGISYVQDELWPGS